MLVNKFHPPDQYLQWAELSFNPIVTGVSLVVILLFCVWTILNKGED